MSLDVDVSEAKGPRVSKVTLERDDFRVLPARSSSGHRWDWCFSANGLLLIERCHVWCFQIQWIIILPKESLYIAKETLPLQDEQSHVNARCSIEMNALLVRGQMKMSSL